MIIVKCLLNHIMLPFKQSLFFYHLFPCMKCISVFCLVLCQKVPLGWWSPLALRVPPSEEPDGGAEWAISVAGHQEYWPTAAPHLLTGNTSSHADLPSTVRVDYLHVYAFMQHKH